MTSSEIMSAEAHMRWQRHETRVWPLLTSLFRRRWRFTPLQCRLGDPIARLHVEGRLVELGPQLDEHRSLLYSA